jgi:hypothetical protein
MRRQQLDTLLRGPIRSRRGLEQWMHEAARVHRRRRRRGRWWRGLSWDCDQAMLAGRAASEFWQRRLRILCLEKGAARGISAGLVAGPTTESLPPGAPNWKLTRGQGRRGHNLRRAGG